MSNDTITYVIAGTAAGIDACLHLVRKELGATVATRIARRMVVPPQRDGGQLQYVESPIPCCSADSRGPPWAECASTPPTASPGCSVR